MKLKVFLIIFFLLMLVFSLSAVLNFPPHSVLPWGSYKSGYFKNIDKKYEVIADSFIGIKILTKPEYAWIFIEEIEKKHEIDIKIYNKKGEEVYTPGFHDDLSDSRVVTFINSPDDSLFSERGYGYYERIIQVKAEKKCVFCHKREKEGELIGLIKFKGKYESAVYQSKERSIIFSFISLLIVIVLIQLFRWNPYGRVKELFDK